MGSDQPIVVIVGPTASGKSAFGMTIAESYHGEIICADSRTVYRGMDILTAKPTPEDQSKIRHWLLDVVDPGQPFSAHAWKTRAEEAILRIEEAGTLPVIVGGTGLYIEGLLYDFSFVGLQAGGNKVSELSHEELLLEAQQVFGVDVVTSDTAGNRRYLERALTSRRLPRSVADRVLPANVILVGLNPPREELYRRIELRVEAMISAGLIDEVRRLSKGSIKSSEAGTAIAYRPILEYLNNEIDLPTVKARLISGDKKLAKKQLTWFRRDPNITWFESAVEAKGYIDKKLAAFLE